MVGDGIEITGLALRTGANLPAGGEDRQRPGAADGGFAVLHPGQDAIDVLGGQFAVPLGMGLEFFQHLSGAGHGLLFALDVDAAILRRDRNRQGLADPPHMLIAGAEERY